MLKGKQLKRDTSNVLCMLLWLGHRGDNEIHNVLMKLALTITQ